MSLVSDWSDGDPSVLRTVGSGLYRLTFRQTVFTHVLLENQVLHALHDELGTSIHDSGEESAESETGRENKLRET